MSDFSLFKDVKWVFFDLDDTLWDFSFNSNVSLKLLYEHNEILQEAFPEYNIYDELYHRVNAALWDRYHHGEITQEYLKCERFRRILEQAFPSRKFSESFCLDLNNQYLRFLESQTQTVTNAKEILQALSPKLMIGILTNGFLDTQYKKLYGSGLDKYVQRMIVSDEIGIQKPDSRIFDYALEATGCNRHEALMIGDNPDTDISGAISSGWKAIYFNRFGKCHDNKSYFTVDNLIDIIGFLG